MLCAVLLQLLFCEDTPRHLPDSERTKHFNLSDASLILFPVHKHKVTNQLPTIAGSMTVISLLNTEHVLQGSHWSLGVIDTDAFTITHYNSLAIDQEELNGHVQRLITTCVCARLCRADVDVPVPVRIAIG